MSQVFLQQVLDHACFVGKIYTKLNAKMSNYTCIVEPLSYYNIIDIGTISRFSKLCSTYPFQIAVIELLLHIPLSTTLK